MAEDGAGYTYDPEHGTGYGEHHKGDVLTAEMQELELRPGTPVTVLETDADTGEVLVQWVDGKGLDRITAIDPDEFSSDFTEG